MDGLFEASGTIVCKAAKLPHGTYLAAELNHVVSQYPTPVQALGFLKKPVNELTMLYVDEGLDFMCSWFVHLFMSGNGLLPICLMPVERATEWKEAHAFRTLRTELAPLGLSAYMTFDREIHIRGRYACPCDMRPVFLKDFRYG